MENQATYCPEDNKLRLYVGRVPRDEYEALRADGWTSTPKQGCDFVAIWTPGREDTALEYADYIGDEDQSPEDRAADRAERFGDYRDKRRDEAHGHADTFDAGPSVHGYQNQDRADRAANRHDRSRTTAVTQWRKAEYWQTRTAGVISHALHKSAAPVRRSRILTLEAELRKAEKERNEAQNRFSLWHVVRDEQSDEKAFALAYRLANSSGCWADYQHPRAAVRYSLYSLLTYEPDPITGHEAAALALGQYADGGPCSEGSSWARSIEHLQNRLQYERQMLEAEGGTAAAADMVPGGFLGTHQIVKVNRSPITRAVVSVAMFAPRRWHQGTDTPPLTLQTFNIQRLPEGAYRAPTAEELAKFDQEQQGRKVETKERNQDAPKLINPTIEDAQRLQDALNAEALEVAKAHGCGDSFKPSEVYPMTQAHYSANSKGSYGRFETKELRQGPKIRHLSNMAPSAEMRRRAIVCKIRACYAGGSFSGNPDRIIVITDKPQKPLPCWAMEEAQPPEPVTAGKLF